MLADELLAHLRHRIGRDVRYAEPPTRLGGGFYTANHRFALAGAPSPWDGAMVVRIFPDHAPDGLDSWEAAVQVFARERGLPAPDVLLHDPGSEIEGRRWFVMELLPGAPAMAGTDLRTVVPGLRRMLRDLPRQTAEMHLALHRLDPGPLVEAFGATATVDRWWSHIVRADGTTQVSHPLDPGVDWLRRNQPEPSAPPALCHGDSWGGNLLVADGEVTGLIDWSVATVAEPALDVAFLTTALTLAPVDAPKPLQRVAQRIGRRIAATYRSAYEGASDADLHPIPYYEALRCLLELGGVVAYRTAVADGRTYDSPRPTWDSIADQMVAYFEQRTGVRLVLPPPVQ